jgi:hypothetical protein
MSECCRQQCSGCQRWRETPDSPGPSTKTPSPETGGEPQSRRVEFSFARSFTSFDIASEGSQNGPRSVPNNCSIVERSGWPPVGARAPGVGGGRWFRLRRLQVRRW